MDFVKKKEHVTVFFDLEKAYNTTWQYGIFKDLFEFGFFHRIVLMIIIFVFAQVLFQTRFLHNMGVLHPFRFFILY